MQDIYTKILTSKKFWKVTIPVFVFFLIAGGFFLYKQNTKEVSASWWNDAWHYRQIVSVTNNTSTEANVYIDLDLDLSDTTKFQADCGDLRFVSEEGEILSYFINEGCANATSSIHVQFAALNSGFQNIYYYYGNPSIDNGFSASDFSTEASDYTIGAVSAQEIAESPVAYWRFDEGSGAIAHDESSGENDGTITGATWQNESLCQVGKCLALSAISDEVLVPNAESLNADAMTVSAWIKTSASSGDIANMLTGEYSLSLVGGKAVFSILVSASGHSVTSPSAVNDGNWHFVLATYDEDTLRMYIDGISVASETSPSGSIDAGAGNIKLANNFSSVNIDEVKIYPYARTAEQVRQDYNAGVAGVSSSRGLAMAFGGETASSYCPLGDTNCDPPKIYLKLDERSGATAYDYSANEIDGTLGAGNSSPTSVLGRYNNAYNFDGVDDYISFGNTGETIKTFSFWLKADSLNEDIMDLDNGSHTISIVSGVLTATGANFSSANIYIDGMDITSIDTNWHFVSITTNSAITVNGFDLGRVSTSYFDGLIDNLIFYDYIRTQKQILHDMSAWSSAQKHPIAYYDFDEGYGDVINDKSGNSHNGTASSSDAGTNTKVANMWSSDGKFGKAMELDGTDDYLSFSDINGIKTISFWVKASTTTEKLMEFLPEWQCGDDVLSDKDGIAYPTVLALDDRCWLKSNLGTSTVATAYNDSDAYGWYYQWGRGIDGHQIGTSLTTTTLSALDQPGHDKFIVTGSDFSYPWRSPVNNRLWQGVDGENNPCSTGWKIPSKNEWIEFYNSEGLVGGYASAFSSSLKLSAAGYRNYKNGSLAFTSAAYWSSDTSASSAYVYNLAFGTGAANGQATGYSVRCIKESSTPPSIEIVSGEITLINIGDVQEYIDGEISSTIDTNWHHVVITTDTTIDAGTLNLGKIGSDYFDGLIDEVKLFNYELSLEEIKNEYNGGVSTAFGSRGTGSLGENDNSASRAICVPGDDAACSFPVGEWKFEKKNSATAYDTSGNGNDGTVTGAVSTIGGVNNSLKFNGTNAYVDVGDINQNLKTISFWFKSNSTTENIIDLDNSGHTISISSGTLSATGFVSPSIYVNGIESTSVSTDWQYITITTDTAIDVNNLDIGRINTSYFDGKIDDVRIYGYARTPAQIAWEYNQGKAVAEWLFNECGGEVAHDQSGGGNHGTINIGASGDQDEPGTCSEVSATSAWYNGRDGKYNSALSFDGVDDYVSVGNTNLDINSISFWAKQDYPYNFFLDLDGGANTITLSGGQVQTTGISSPTIYIDGEVGTTIPDNSWHQVTVVTDTPIDVSDKNIGKVGTNYYAGFFDNIKLYNYSLTLAQVKSAYNSGSVSLGYDIQPAGVALVLLEDGAICSVALACEGGACSDDWSTGNNICHADDTQCAYDNGGSVEEYASGWEKCSGNDWYKTCASSTQGIWGSSAACDTTPDYQVGGAPNYCQEQLADTCSDGASGGCVPPAWTNINEGAACDATDICIGETYYTDTACSSGSCTGGANAQDKDSSQGYCEASTNGCTAQTWISSLGTETGSNSLCCGDDGGSDDWATYSGALDSSSSVNCRACSDGSDGGQTTLYGNGYYEDGADTCYFGTITCTDLVQSNGSSETCEDSCVDDNDGGSCVNTHNPSSAETCYYNDTCGNDTGCAYSNNTPLRQYYCDSCSSSGVTSGGYCPLSGTGNAGTCYYGTQSCSGPTCDLSTCAYDTSCGYYLDRSVGESCNTGGCVACPSSCPDNDDTDCDANAHCNATGSATGACVADLAGGGVCVENSDCTSNNCEGGTCFECGVSTVPYGGKSYLTVLIGSQCWFRENLDIGTVTTSLTGQVDDATIQKWCYNNSQANGYTGSCGDGYGGLYQWAETIQYANGATNTTSPSPALSGNIQGICPSGWHIPTHDEYTTLERAVCTTGTCATDFPHDTTTTGYRGTNEGSKLAGNAGLWNNGVLDSDIDFGSRNFDVFPAGLGYNSSGALNFYGRGSDGNLWSSSESSSPYAWHRFLNSSHSSVYRNYDTKTSGFSVRCLKN
ncbi:hypothetical protein C0584_02680 [Candidatus Parcubacteria bacterium]|nr:MAG: hypothetical protein C0584_02680 [Candidatus Parcubacteria bacterium]